MKTLILICIFLFYSGYILAQDFAPVGAEWYYSESFAFSGDENYLYIKSEKDTVFHGVTCRELVKNHLLGCSGRPQIEYVYSKNDTVFFWDEAIGKFQILYDFNAKKNSSWIILQKGSDDGIDTIKVNIDSVVPVTINNRSLKLLYVKYDVIDTNPLGGYNYSYSSKIIEKIGDKGYLFNLFTSDNIACDGNMSDGLRCYEDPEFGFYSTGIADSCTYTYDWFAHLFGTTGTEWYYNVDPGGSAPENSEYYHFKSVGNEIISGNYCYEIERTYYKYDGTAEELEPYYIAMGARYVYLYNPVKEKFDLLYDFYAKKGDVITLNYPYEMQSENMPDTYRVKVDSVCNETFDGTVFKKFHVIPLDGVGWSSTWYMENVGGLDWFIPQEISSTKKIGPLRCFHNNSLDIKFVDYDCDYRIVSVPDENMAGNIVVTPNPTKGIINFTLPDSKLVTLDIYDESGRLLQESSINTKSQVNLSAYQNGIYILKFKDHDTTIALRKIIKQGH